MEPLRSSNMTHGPAQATRGDDLVHIRSHHGYWRPRAAGYADDPREAGVWLRDAAEIMVSALGPDRSVELVDVKPLPSSPCPGCGSTKPLGHYEGTGFVACCPDRPGASSFIEIVPGRYDAGPCSATIRVMPGRVSPSRRWLAEQLFDSRHSDETVYGIVRENPLIDAGAKRREAAMREALTMVRDADNDCRKDDLPTMPSMARNAIDRALACTGRPPEVITRRSAIPVGIAGGAR